MRRLPLPSQGTVGEVLSPNKIGQQSNSGHLDHSHSLKSTVCVVLILIKVQLSNQLVGPILDLTCIPTTQVVSLENCNRAKHNIKQL